MEASVLCKATHDPPQPTLLSGTTPSGRSALGSESRQLSDEAKKLITPVPTASAAKDTEPGSTRSSPGPRAFNVLFSELPADRCGAALLAWNSDVSYAFFRRKQFQQLFVTNPVLSQSILVLWLLRRCCHAKTRSKSIHGFARVTRGCRWDARTPFTCSCPITYES